MEKSFSAFTEIHRRWNYESPEVEAEVLRSKKFELNYLQKLKLFNNWRYVTTYIMKAERLMCEKADAFNQMMLKRRAFIGIISVN